MASFGKKILNAFMEVEETKKDAPGNITSTGSPEQNGVGPAPATGAAAPADQRFTDYFDTLFKEANPPGPDYYEFARMITAMRAIPDERARYAAAYAGLQVQGLDRDKLLTTAAEYLRILTSDADHFAGSVESALQEKVHAKTAEAQEKSKRIQALSQEILGLQTQIGVMQKEIDEAKGKLEANSNAYTAESESRKQQIQNDIEKINLYIH